MDFQGVRCLVRRWRTSDAESIARHANNPRVAMQLRDRFPHPYRVRDARSFLRQTAGSSDPTDLAIDVEGMAVGGIGFTPGTDIERYSAEIGYWLGESYWGRGIVTEALEMVSAGAFERLGLLRLFALPFADNVASARVLEKAGYTREGLLRSSAVKYGRVRDQLLYSRISSRWHAPAAESPGG